MVDYLDISAQPRDQLLASLAESWRIATQDLAFIPLTQSEIRLRFAGLAADVLDAVQPTTTPEIVIAQGRAIGRALVKLNLLKSETLERTLTCLNEHLIDMVAPQQLGRLLAGIAGGFAAATDVQARETVAGVVASVVIHRPNRASRLNAAIMQMRLLAWSKILVRRNTDIKRRADLRPETGHKSRKSRSREFGVVAHVGRVTHVDPLNAQAQT